MVAQIGANFKPILIQLAKEAQTWPIVVRPPPGALPPACRIPCEARRGSPLNCGRRSSKGATRTAKKLPAERQFASAFGASRATIRSALIRLETGARYAAPRRRHLRNYENPGDADDVAELTSPLELIDVRLGIEPNMVQLAVLNATGRDIERLANAIARMERSSGDSESFTLWDTEFHQADFGGDTQSAEWCGSIDRSTRCAPTASGPR